MKRWRARSTSVLGTFDRFASERVRLGEACVEFLLDPQTHLERQRTDGVDDQRADGVVDVRARDLLAERMSVLDALTLAGVDREQRAAGVAIAYGHPQAAFPTDHEAL